MAVSSIHCLASLAALVITGIVISGNHVSAEKCQLVDFTDLGYKCYIYVTSLKPKAPPSAECCDALKKADLPCLCKILPENMHIFLDMDKVVYVADTCGVPIPRGQKCGMFIIPPAAAPAVAPAAAPAAA